MRNMKRRAKKDIFSASKKTKKFSHLPLFITSIIFSTIYLVWRTLFTIPHKYGIVAMIIGVFLLIAEIMAAAEAMIQFRQITKRMIPELPSIPDDWFPEVDVFIATHNESSDLLYKTINACTYLRYPDKSKVHVYLCDDNNRPEMAELAAQLKIGYFGLSNNKHAKAGNLNNAMRQTNSPLIVTLDSDMIPTSDFLLNTVPYFFLPKLKKDKESGLWVPREESELDPGFKIGFIQTPQSFYNPDLFQYNLFSETRIPNEQDYFFREVNVGRNADNGVIYAGSNTVLSRKALEEVGYIATTSITEDFMTGLRIQKKGYTTYAVPNELAHGLAPNTITSLLKQRERWGRGCIQALRQEHLLTTPSLSFWTKLSYLATWSYWWAFARRMIYIISPILSVLYNLPVMGVFTWQVIVFWFPHYVFSNIALRSFSRGVRNRHWSNVYDTILFPYLIGPILFETLGVKKRKFVVTDKNPNKKRRDLSVLFALPHIELFIASALALLACVRVSIVTNSFYSPIIFFWLIMNIKNILFAVFFMYGRDNLRVADRFYVSEPVTMTYGGVEYSGHTSDMSETGLAVLFSKPIYFPLDSNVSLHIEYSDYTADMKVEIIHVAQVGDKWKYSVRIVELDEINKSHYMQIVYDRSHTMPRNLDSTLSIFDDFNINFTNRTKKTTQIQLSRYAEREASLRKLPRIRLEIPFVSEKVSGIIVDFNYSYMIIQCDDPDFVLDKNELLKLEIEPGAVLYLETLPDEIEREKGVLFHITNAAEFASSPDIDHIVETWLNIAASGERPTASGSIVKKTFSNAEELQNV